MTWDAGEFCFAGSEDEDPLNDDLQNEYAHEDELRDQAEHEPLGGADVDHLQRMRG